MLLIVQLYCMATNFTIAFVDDNKVNRNTFLQKIKLLPDFTLLFTAENGHQCLEELRGLPHHKIPQVIFMDLEMPEMDGVETIRLAKALYPSVHYIVLTVFDDDEKIFEAIKAGASGYLLKHEPAQVLYESVVNVIEFGGAPMSPAIARKSLQLLGRAQQLDSHTEPGQSKNTLPQAITQREKEILQHMVNGWDAKHIASVVDLSVLTVRKHIANIYDKLHINSKAQAISLAHQQKWFEK